LRGVGFQTTLKAPKGLGGFRSVIGFSSAPLDPTRVRQDQSGAIFATRHAMVDCWEMKPLANGRPSKKI
jgi:hypothetical protein